MENTPFIYCRYYNQEASATSKINATTTPDLKILQPQGSPLEGKSFLAVLNSPQINDFFSVDVAHVNASIKQQQAAATGKLRTNYRYEGAITLVFRSPNGIALSEDDNRLFDFCAHLLTTQNDYKDRTAPNDLVRFSLEEYAALIDYDISTKPRKDKFRLKVKESLARLRSIDVVIKDEKAGVERQYNFGVMQGTTNKRGGMIEFQFGAVASQLIQSRYIALLHPKIFAARTALAYQLGRYLCIRYNIDSDVQRGTHNIISVKALLKRLPSIVSYDELKRQKDSHWRRRIYERLDEALCELEDLGVLKWEYCQAKKEPLTAEQLDFAEYTDFERAYIHFDIIGEPDQAERRAKRIETAKKRKERQERARDKYIGQAQAKKALKAAEQENSSPEDEEE